MTRSMRQLWDEREKFLRFDRGWLPKDDDVEELDLDTILADKFAGKSSILIPTEVDYGPQQTVDEDVKKRLQDVEDFYVRFRVSRKVSY